MEQATDRFDLSQDVKPPPSDPDNPDAPPRPLDLLEITAGPGTFARLLADDPDRIASVEVMEWSGTFWTRFSKYLGLNRHLDRSASADSQAEVVEVQRSRRNATCPST